MSIICAIFPQLGGSNYSVFETTLKHSSQTGPRKPSIGARSYRSLGGLIIILVVCLLQATSVVGHSLSVTGAGNLPANLLSTGLADSSTEPVGATVGARHHSRYRHLSLSATTLNFGNVAVGSAPTHPLTLTSTGTAAVTIDQATLFGATFSLARKSFPLTLHPKQSVTLEVQFRPTAPGADGGHLTITSNSSSGSTATVALNGTGTAGTSPHLSVSATSLSFGSVTVNSTSVQSVTLTSNGTAAVTIDAAALTGPGFTVTGATFPATLNPNQSATLQVQFKPTIAGADAGQLTISSNSSGGATAMVALSGTGTAATQHEVDLSWIAPSNSPVQVASYNVYRSTGTSGAYLRLNSATDVQTVYVDRAVVAGLSYDYFVRSVDYAGTESNPSNPITVTIP